MSDSTLLERLLGYLPGLAQGAGMTVVVSGCAIVIGFTLGAMLLGLSRAGRPVARAGVTTYVSFFRGTPMLVQLLMMFYLPAAAGVDLAPTLAALLALGLNSAAFQCEILRAGLATIAPGQLEAARSFGLSARQVFGHIELPQIARAVWPAVVSEAVDVIKGSAIISAIAVTELARTGRQIAAGNFRPLEVYLVVALMYLLLTLAAQLLGRVVQRRLVTPGRAHRLNVRSKVPA